MKTFFRTRSIILMIHVTNDLMQPITKGGGKCSVLRNQVEGKYYVKDKRHGGVTKQVSECESETQLHHNFAG